MTIRADSFKGIWPANDDKRCDRDLANRIPRFWVGGTERVKSGETTPQVLSNRWIWNIIKTYNFDMVSNTSQLYWTYVDARKA